MADPHQLEQVLINLMVNARDVIQAHAKVPKKKRIIIETKYIYLDKAYLEAYSGLREVAHIQLSISDTGTGMDKQWTKYLSLFILPRNKQRNRIRIINSIWHRKTEPSLD